MTQITPDNESKERKEDPFFLSIFDVFLTFTTGMAAGAVGLGVLMFLVGLLLMTRPIADGSDLPFAMRLLGVFIMVSSLFIIRKGYQNLKNPPKEKPTRKRRFFPRQRRRR